MIMKKQKKDVSKIKTEAQKLFSFYFNIPLYGIDIIIIVGAKCKKDIKNRLERYGVSDKLVKLWIETDTERLLNVPAGTIYFDAFPGTIYFFRDWKDDLGHKATLVHEISHMVDKIAEWKNIEHETEARAYLTDYLFRVIYTEMNRE